VKDKEGNLKDEKVTDEVIYLRYGQVDDNPLSRNDYQINGLGRKLRLWPIYEDQHKTTIKNYISQLCYIEEG